MTSTDYATVRASILEHEGLRLLPYLDTRGNTSIGVGRNLTDKGITKAEAMEMLEHDLEESILAVQKALPWFNRLDGPRQRVLVEMCFNLGLTGLLDFQKMLAACEAGDFDTAAGEMMNSKWAGQVKGRAQALASLMRA